MKVFWSWQSDHDGKVSHYFVRDALNDAIKTLKAESTLHEPTEADRRTQLHLDHDTKGNTGWVDITQSIFEKIEASAVFIADVTPVASSPSKKDGNREEVGMRPIMNPNVAIELGYALKALDWKKIIPIMNTAYGSVERMPFDIDRTRRWAIRYNLKEGAAAADIKAARAKLASDFVNALRGYLAVPDATRQPFPERPHVGTPAFFFPPHQPLGSDAFRDETLDYTLDKGPAFYLRLIPRAELPRPLNLMHMLKNVTKLGAFGMVQGGLPRENEEGAAIFDPRGNDGAVDSVSQVFRNGELWGVNTTVLRPGMRQGTKWVHAQVVETVFQLSLASYVRFMRDICVSKPPYTVEGGIIGVKNWELFVTHNQGAGENYGPMNSDVQLRQTLASDTEEEQERFLLKLFQKMFDQSGRERPLYYNGFPRDPKRLVAR